MSITRAAAFLDRDGTIIVDSDHVSRPEDVHLLPGSAEIIARLNAAHVPVIVVTNQSGIGRGLFTIEDYERVRRRLDELLALLDAHIDATYLCPHSPDTPPPCACRKPGTLLYERAASEHSLDPVRSIFVGDRWRDVAPGLALGGRGILVASPRTPEAELERARSEARIAPSLGDAVAGLLGPERRSTRSGAP